jgi:diguanylate cyclase (GGDEF)-like protein
LKELSEQQAVAVAPFLKALSELIAGSNSQQEQHEAARALTPPVDSKPHLAAGPLELLEHTLSQALDAKDPKGVRDAISKCLEIVRTEKAKPVASSVISAAPVTSLNVDAETGLPNRSLFERIVADSIAEGRQFITALFVVERLPLINKRFGRLAGDRVLLYVARYLAQELPDSNSLSRWSGSAFSAIINAENSEKMESQIRAISNKPLSANIDVGNRSVMLTISCACMMEQLSADAEPEKLFGKMDDFVKVRTSS